MRILVISFYDDNFGDMLIRMCFDRILRIVMKNLGISDEGYAARHMHIKHVCDSDVAQSSLVIFAGGAMFGENYLGTYDCIDRITSVAQEHDVPVVFSSIGINNNRAKADSIEKLSAVLRRPCVKAMSTREAVEAFEAYTKDCGFAPVQVCDPAVWTQYLYAGEIKQAREAKQGRIVGINFVRGGLFKDNGHSWTLTKEERCLNGLRKLLENREIDYRFFTNGSLYDNNSLQHFASACHIPGEKVCYPDNTREVVSAVAGCDAVIAIRMHASIISYALGVPSVNLVWNEKIPYFYSAIGHPERALAIDEAEPELLFDQAAILLEERDYRPDRAYMMSLYHFLLDTLAQQLCLKRTESYGFERVCEEFALTPATVCDDIADYRI